MNIWQVEEMYGITPRQLRRWRDRNIGPPFKRFGNQVILYEVGALERWLDALPDGNVKAS